MINSTFTNNTAPHGAVIYSLFTRIEIINSTFIGNIADVYGGVIAQNCDLDERFLLQFFDKPNVNEFCSVKITDSTFIENGAKDKGGILHFNLNPPIVTNSTMLDNWSGTGYGPEYASYPVRVALNS